ncbi:uncharacterized protein EHS24_000191 [Apiotrichum porosum]|uniref:Uncharacterized protein n=1 Tax=Apiotrichum porosum TaxID=105984 RepID=A0A427Y9Q6_9TREE|nr:uncharacterized protein EHS24_000191 [Apiotrichum porosum]RSH87677.1 hypothetical protein EHS24_000191 [Apiotrichum porosum]
MTPVQPTTHLYRAVLREMRLASRQPRATRNPVVGRELRAMIDEARLCTTSPKDADALDRALLEAGDFMRAARIHARYNPIHGMSEQERIHATARRVGLDTPVEYKKDE